MSGPGKKPGDVHERTESQGGSSIVAGIVLLRYSESHTGA